MSDGLAVFLASCDPDVVSREWTSASFEDALLEAPRSGPRREVRKKQSRAQRLLAELDAWRKGHGMEVVRVYSKPDCVQCDRTKKLMDREGIEFVEESILEEGNMAAAKELGLLTAPVVAVGAEVWAGFRPDKIMALAARIGEKA